jgi:hypothetical protein
VASRKSEPTNRSCSVKRSKSRGEIRTLPRDIREQRVAPTGIQIERAIEQRAQRSPQLFVESKHLLDRSSDFDA